MWPLVNCSREMPFLGLLFTLLIPLDSQIHFVFRGKRKIRKIMCIKNKISYCLAFENNTVEISGLLLFFYLYFSCVSLFFFPFIFISWRLKNIFGASLVVQWLRLCASKAGGPGSIPGQGTKSHVLQSCMLLRSPGAPPLPPKKKSQRLFFFFFPFSSLLLDSWYPSQVGNASKPRAPFDLPPIHRSLPASLVVRPQPCPVGIYICRLDLSWQQLWLRVRGPRRLFWLSLAGCAAWGKSLFALSKSISVTWGEEDRFPCFLWKRLCQSPVIEVSERQYMSLVGKSFVFIRDTSSLSFSLLDLAVTHMMDTWF